jgi:hypothetical protein
MWPWNRYLLEVLTSLGIIRKVLSIICKLGRRRLFARPFLKGERGNFAMQGSQGHEVAPRGSWLQTISLELHASLTTEPITLSERETGERRKGGLG